MGSNIMASVAVLVLALSATVAPRPDFSGSWTMDRARSFGLPGNMNQTMVVTQKGDQIEVETKLIQPDNERTVKDSYVLDGKEYDFTPQAPPGSNSAKGQAHGQLDAGWQRDPGDRSYDV